jgi:hypothetical protein
LADHRVRYGRGLGLGTLTGTNSKPLNSARVSNEVRDARAPTLTPRKHYALVRQPGAEGLHATDARAARSPEKKRKPLMSDTRESRSGNRARRPCIPVLSLFSGPLVQSRSEQMAKRPKETFLFFRVGLVVPRARQQACSCRVPLAGATRRRSACPRSYVHAVGPTAACGAALAATEQHTCAEPGMIHSADRGQQTRYDSRDPCTSGQKAETACEW